MMEAVGVDLLALETEYGPGQFEMPMRPSVGIVGADNSCTFRTGVGEICQKHGLRASFYVAAHSTEACPSYNGGHFNFSVGTAPLSLSLFTSPFPLLPRFRVQTSYFPASASPALPHQHRSFRYARSVRPRRHLTLRPPLPRGDPGSLRRSLGALLSHTSRV